MDGWMDGCQSRVKDCLQQSISRPKLCWMGGWMDGWKLDGWMGGKAGLRIAYSNQKLDFDYFKKL